MQRMQQELQLQARRVEDEYLQISIRKKLDLPSDKN